MAARGRRQFLRTLTAGTGAIATGVHPVATQAQAGRPRATLPPRRDLVIRRAYVITVDERLGDVPDGDVHVRDGAIAAVGRNLRVSGATDIDGRNTIVMPGFVDTHWHMWNGVFRGMTQTPTEYFALQTLAQQFTPADHYTSITFAAAEAINAGITTVHDWAHGLQSPAAAESEMQALVDSGVRARFGCGNLQRTTAGGKELTRFIEWAQARGDRRLSVGAVLQNGQTWREEIAAARAAGARTIAPHVDVAASPELMGPDVIMTHGGAFTPAVIQTIANRQAKMALCPTTDLLMGMGLPPVTELLDAGVPADHIGLSVDVTCQTCADPFQMMRIVLGVARNKAGDATRLTPRQVLRMATLGGATVLGLQDEIGSIAPGRRADLVMLRTDDINMLPATQINSTFLVVLGAQPANVDTVVIDGRLVKRDGKVTTVDIAGVTREAAALQARLRAAGAFPPVNPVV